MIKLVRKHQANSVRREVRKPGGFTPTPLARSKAWGVYPHTSKKVWGVYPHTSKKVWGFTLVEMVVAVGLFALVTVVLTSTFLTVFRNQRNAFAFVHMQNNVRHALEVMGREMRTGRDFTLGTGGWISFIDDRGRGVTYSLGGSAIQKNGVPVTARNVSVTRLAFHLTGQDSGDSQQPRITIFIRVQPEARPGEPEIFSTDLQLTITPRGLDM